jgi:hypothetical protein
MSLASSRASRVEWRFPWCDGVEAAPKDGNPPAYLAGSRDGTEPSFGHTFVDVCRPTPSSERFVEVDQVWALLDAAAVRERRITVYRASVYPGRVILSPC